VSQVSANILLGKNKKEQMVVRIEGRLKKKDWAEFEQKLRAFIELHAKQLDLFDMSPATGAGPGAAVKKAAKKTAKKAKKTKKAKKSTKSGRRRS
jgi:hypothetical protein